MLPSGCYRAERLSADPDVSARFQNLHDPNFGTGLKHWHRMNSVLIRTLVPPPLPNVCRRDGSGE
jgi:hypothetical protein